jgi:23S rRNA A2030 N6-methylase RlmJ
MATSTSISTQLTSVPTELQPYITKTYSDAEIAKGAREGLLPTAQKLLTADYDTTYGDPLKKAGLAGSGRIANVSPLQNTIAQELQGMRTPDQYAMGTGSTALGLGALSSMLSPEQTQAYMSPYVQNVLNVNKDEAERDARRNLVNTNLAAARQGAYGGSRNLLAQTELDRNLQTKLGRIQAEGMQNAFEAAQKAQLAQAAGYGQLGQTFGQLGTAQQASDIDRIKTMGAYGDLQRAIQQQQLDAQYQDAMSKLNYPLTSLETMNNLIRGIPLTQSGKMESTTTPPPSFASQLGGMGLSGLALYNMFGNRP